MVFLHFIINWKRFIRYRAIWCRIEDERTW